MSLLRDIQDAAINSSIKLSDLLRKCLVLAARLKNTEFKQWVEKELNGYNNKDELPKYRILSVHSQGDFSGSFQSGLRNAPIPPMCIDKKFREFATTSYMTQPISALEDLVKEQKSGDLQSPWPPDLAALVGQKIYQDMNCLSAWQTIPRNNIVAILDTVRNRILNFVLEIEAEAPDAGEASPGIEPVPQEKVDQVFNTIIMGNVSNLAAGGKEVRQSAVIINENDLDSLKKYMLGLGVSPPDIEALDKALADDARTSKGRKIGANVGNWIGKIIGKASEGALKIGTDVASSVITKAISQYLGLDV